MPGLIGIVISIGLWIIGVPNALLLGMMVGLMNIIPYFGAIIGGVVCVIIAFLSGNIYSALLTGIYIIVMQQVDGNFIQPRIVGARSAYGRFMSCWPSRSAAACSASGVSCSACRLWRSCRCCCTT